ncbi:hypothetical protein RhiirA5_358401 [Rhizophagus irregularis]|uniref:Uncharacterized protein n=3 Tax=Rhizophagus irregularis TaxID=588596 RepID=U9SW25_RHIID|nr:hypothetical protein GLOIN_2v1590480 [Rhizophagus irregularis DAOM 181602=DAOM 197198]EXX74930.1 hypothetical protein RirG_046590 [Rhizophagus irregularis DAOM 197198w]PKC08044.1 hypothetical protein RhiirA5_358401 [Rhizophagus irregularis]PKY20593.1 hypothetical protein RhiirB3_408490 [Rhizophagus irregularis]POG73078.1 hypothetical protein GLOIN_2v1590480 [Rhizophagus irregularis DAOM 181602=DAOM 197198]UZO25060.1 hypothetical protein OCT59_017346 [Rhizophagus irregularis]|eukprot:XP_025179944.1 hypothetical protein GLOIN_2v1590480 [Rhizophagus irregularis DAOM 181602=DAOM 197198]
MSYFDYKEPDFNAYRKNALCSLQQIASEANILPKQKNLIIHPKKDIVIESCFPLVELSSSQQEHPKFNSSVKSSLLQQSVILNSIKGADWSNEEDGWIFIKNADDEKETGVKREVEPDELQSYEILRKGGESVKGYNGNIHQHDSKSYKENSQVSNIKHHLEDDDVYLFL